MCGTKTEIHTQDCVLVFIFQLSTSSFAAPWRHKPGLQRMSRKISANLPRSSSMASVRGPVVPFGINRPARPNLAPTVFLSLSHASHTHFSSVLEMSYAMIYNPSRMLTTSSPPRPQTSHVPARSPLCPSSRPPCSSSDPSYLSRPRILERRTVGSKTKP